MVHIKCYKDNYRGIPSNGKLIWVVKDTKYNCSDIYWSFEDAIRYFLWHLGVPPRIVFRKYGKKKSE